MANNNKSRGPYKKAVPITTTDLCAYNCGNIAKFVNCQGVLCCSQSHNACPTRKKQNSNGILLSRDAMTTADIKHMYGARYESCSEEAKKRMNHNKGKTKDTYQPLANASATFSSNRQSAKHKSREITESRQREIGMKTSATIIQKIINDDWHFNNVFKNVISYYKGIAFHSSWEIKYAQWLDINNIQWVRNKDSFLYEWEGKTKRYLPDFYLPDTNEYVEIKGRKMPIDEAKWSQFPSDKKLTVLMKLELNKLGIKV